MSDLIRQTLGWSTGSWPPDYYTLLSLSPGPVDPDRVEAAVLDRMEKLRVFQLVHPESVTEAMNLLAKALVTLSDPAAKAEYDLGLGVVGRGQEAGVRSQETGDRVEETAKEEEEETQEREQVSEGAGEKEPFDERESAEPKVVLELLEPAPVVRAPTDVERAIVGEWPAALPSGPIRKSKRKRFVRRPAAENVRWVVAVRQLLEAWDRAGDWMAIPELTFATRTEAVQVILALRHIAKHGPVVIDVAGPGRFVLELAQSDPVSSTLMDVPIQQRQTLARDWRLGRKLILAEYERTRRRMNRYRRRLRIPPPWQRTLATWGLWFFGAAALVIIAVRSWRGT